MSIYIYHCRVGRSASAVVSFTKLKSCETDEWVKTEDRKLESKQEICHTHSLTHLQLTWEENVQKENEEKKKTTCRFKSQLSEEHVKRHLPPSPTALHIHNKRLHLQHKMSLRARDFTAVGENIMPMCVLMAKWKNVKVDGKNKKQKEYYREKKKKKKAQLRQLGRERETEIQVHTGHHFLLRVLAS